jgi:hypothetical protein
VPNRGSASFSLTNFSAVAGSISPAVTADAKIPICCGAGGTIPIDSALEFVDMPVAPMSNTIASRLRRKMKGLLE